MRLLLGFFVDIPSVLFGPRNRNSKGASHDVITLLYIVRLVGSASAHKRSISSELFLVHEIIFHIGVTFFDAAVT